MSFRDYSGPSMITTRDLERKTINTEQGNGVHLLPSDSARMQTTHHFSITGETLLCSFKWSEKRNHNLALVLYADYTSPASNRGFVSLEKLFNWSTRQEKTVLFSDLLFIIKDVHFTVILMKSDLNISTWSQNGLSNLKFPSAMHGEILRKAIRLSR